MCFSFTRCALLAAGIAFLAPGASLLAAEKEKSPIPVVEEYLEKGRLAEADTALQAVLKKNPQDQQARFSLGVVQFLQAIEQMGQAHHRYGLLQHRMLLLPLTQMPIPKNESPEELTYEAARKILDTFVTELGKAEATLAEVDTTDVKLPLHFGRIRLDLNSDGTIDDEEALWKILSRFQRGIDQVAGESFLITFDGGDVHWLRGYCHLLSGFGETALAHDWHEIFERAGHLLYPRVKTPYTYLAGEKKDPKGWDYHEVMDLIAFIHSMNFPVVAPERMQRALGHFEAMIEQSRASWKRILAETDDDHEWVPNPQQTGVIPNVRVRREMIDGWHEMLDEMEAIFQGKKLVPFWRGPGANEAGQLGVNLRRVFTEPRQFDLVLWITGTGAAPYLEKGELTDARVWSRLQRIFGGEFIGFAIWFN